MSNELGRWEHRWSRHKQIDKTDKWTDRHMRERGTKGGGERDGQREVIMSQVSTRMTKNRTRKANKNAKK